MTLVFLRSYSKARNNLLSCGHSKTLSNCLAIFFPIRTSSDDKSNYPEFTNSTIIIENGYNVHELPVIVRKLKDLDKLEHSETTVPSKTTNESFNYHLIQEEFKQCIDLREVFSLITKCTKITPNIALGAIERINDLEEHANNNLGKENQTHVHINFAKGAILEKLQKVVMKTENTQTILNVLKTNSTIMEPLKYKFSDELVLRVIDNKLTIEQLCDFAMFLVKNSSDQKYSETVDRLWVGFVDKENKINEDNIVHIFNILPGLKASKRTLSLLLEQKLSEIWYKIKPQVVQEILNIYVTDKYFSTQSLTVLSHWLYVNIHSLHEDELLDIVTKFTRLKYSHDQIIGAVEKYMKLKGSKISSHILIAGIYNFCMQFQLCNKLILNTCSEYFISNMDKVPSSFLKCFIYPHGYLNSDPLSGSKYWKSVEDLLLHRFDNISIDDMCSILLTFIYLGHHPVDLVSKIFQPGYLAKVKNPELYKKLQLIDTALSLECKNIPGPMLPKDQCYTPISQDIRITNILTKIKTTLINAICSPDMLSMSVSIPNYCSDSTYLIDVMIHPPGMRSSTFNWKMKTDRFNVTGVLIHLPEHFCSDDTTLIGPQAMRIRHMRILGLKVVSLKYSMLSQLYASQDNSLLVKYISDAIKNNTYS